MNDCDRYWAYSNVLPIDQVITYWCETSGHSAEHCKAAKRAAIIQACKEKKIAYARSDGRTFDDPIEDMAGRGILTIERNSFDAWVTDNFAQASPLPERPLSTTERNTLLTIIAVLCKEYKLDYTKHAKTAGLIHGMAQFMKVSIGETTIENHLKKIPDALGTRTT